eukprot:gnl/Dysnectes_brevis/4443_a5978_728.p1 GENE.gnl/Dysnectes_brevis/4443_a5978_728~~gnl/Dysnectes_brevis/4443_a5978_728.p1  ORF type:complete len:451 (+),score=81.68 gnl/Dysnectes_brevis/4443_a5978_728:78-1430(+)
MPQYLAVFVHFHVTFHLDEFKSQVAQHGCTDVIINDYESPFLFFESSLESAVTVVTHCSLARFLIEVYASETTEERLLQSITPSIRSKIQADVSAANSYAFRYFAIGRTITFEEKLAAYERYHEPIGPFATKVSLSAPAITLAILEECIGIQEDTRQGRPVRRVLGSLICDGSRSDQDKYTLKRRKYLGPTSMDAALAALMVNLGRVKPGSKVVDPFAGTCSILVAAAAKGAITCGGELNVKVIAGKGAGKTFRNNFEQYDIPTTELVHCDCGHSPLNRPGTWDSIITDPPYGIRAGCRKQGAGDAHASRRWGREGVTLVDVSDIFLSLASFARTSLKVGGTLVFWQPCLLEDFDQELDLPIAQGLRLVCCPLQPLSRRHGRRLCVYVKESEGMSGNPPRYGREEPSHHRLAWRIGFHQESGTAPGNGLSGRRRKARARMKKSAEDKTSE